MIIIIISLLRPPIHSPPFLQNFSNDDQSSILGVVRKQKYPIYLSNLSINGHLQELGYNATKVIYVSCAHSNIACTNMSVTPHPKEGLKYHHQILLQDSPEGYAKYVRYIEFLLLTYTSWSDSRQYLLATRMRTQYPSNGANFTNLYLRDAFSLNILGW